MDCLKKIHAVTIMSWTAKIFSLSVSVLFWLSVGANTVGCLLFAAMGFLFDATKFIAFARLAHAIVSARYASLLAVLPICLVFSLVSVFSSVSIINNQVAIQRVSLLQQDANYINQKNNIKLQEQKIANLNVAIAKDIKYGYRERARSINAELNVEQQKLQVLYAELRYQSKNTANDFFNHVPAKYLQATIVLLGSLLELAAIFLTFLEFTAKQPHSPHVKHVLKVNSKMNSRKCASSSHSKMNSKKCTSSSHSKMNSRKCTSSAHSKTNINRNNVVDIKPELKMHSEFKTALQPSALKVISSKGNVKILHEINKVHSKCTRSSQENELQAECMHLMKSATLLPSSRALRAHFNIGSKLACKLLRNLMGEGFLISKGNGYALA